MREALTDWKLLIFRGQNLHRDRHVELAARFGEPFVHPLLQRVEGTPMMILDARADRQEVARWWHTDMTFLETPPLLNILRAVTIPKVGGDTVFANMERAYEELDSPFQQTLCGLHALHGVSNTYVTEKLPASAAKTAVAQLRARHPVIRTHPDTSRQCIFVNELYTQSVEGLTDGESHALLQRLFQLPKRPEYQCRVRWREGTVVIWDHRNTQHYAVPDFFPERRTLERVTVAGSKPY